MIAIDYTLHTVLCRYADATYEYQIRVIPGMRDMSSKILQQFYNTIRQSIFPGRGPQNKCKNMGLQMFRFVLVSSCRIKGPFKISWKNHFSIRTIKYQVSLTIVVYHTYLVPGRWLSARATWYLLESGTYNRTTAPRLHASNASQLNYHKKWGQIFISDFFS